MLRAIGLYAVISAPPAVREAIIAQVLPTSLLTLVGCVGVMLVVYLLNQLRLGQRGGLPTLPRGETLQRFAYDRLGRRILTLEALEAERSALAHRYVKTISSRRRLTLAERVRSADALWRASLQA